MSNIEALRNKHGLKDQIIEESTTSEANNISTNQIKDINEINNNIENLNNILLEKIEYNKSKTDEKKNLNIKKQTNIEDIQSVIDSVSKLNITSDKIRTQVNQNNELDKEINDLKKEIVNLDDKYSLKLKELNDSLDDINFFLQNQEKE
tara:strand:+ start:473 stop:919 length:447 start_codon:yes stop_codon:yes gene_type:complete